MSKTHDADFADLFRDLHADPARLHSGDRLDVRIDAQHIRRAMAVVALAEVRETLDQWLLEDRKSAPGGRPPWMTPYQALVLLMALVLEGSPLLITDLERAIVRMTDRACKEIGLPPSRAERQRAYCRAWRATSRLIRVMDPCPFPKARRLTVQELAEFTASLDPEFVAERKARLTWFTNRLLHATFLVLPEEVRAAWTGDTAVDGTRILAVEKGNPNREKMERPGFGGERVSSFADAGWHTRHKGEDGLPLPGGKTSRSRTDFHWAYEAHLVQAQPAFGGPDNFPRIIVGAAFDKPAHAPGANAVIAYDDMARRGLPSGTCLSDRGYFSGASAENFAIPMRALGHRLVGDYKRADLGVIRASVAGAVMIEGQWYCPSIPSHLVTANARFAAGEIDEDKRQRLLAQRVAYEVRPKQAPGHDGKQVMMCPAAGAGATVTCMLKNEVTAARGPIVTGGRPLLSLAVTPKNPDRICTNASSVTFEAHAGAKWKQDGPAYGTTAWQKIYGQRSQIEAANAHFKDQAHEGGDNAGRRRKRGLAAQAVMVTLLLVSSNMRRIKAFLTREVETPERATPVWRRSALAPSAQVERIQQSREGPPLAA